MFTNSIAFLWNDKINGQGECNWSDIAENSRSSYCCVTAFCPITQFKFAKI